MCKKRGVHFGFIWWDGIVREAASISAVVTCSFTIADVFHRNFVYFLSFRI